MAKLKTYTEFVNEKLIDAIKNPIKYTKIKNNMKKYQDGLVKQALNDTQYKKKKEASKGELTDKQKETLKAANDAKNAALKDTTTAVAQRMDDLATTPGLQKVVSLGKTKSRIAANKTILKAATGEEAKKLKIRQKELAQKAADTKTALKDFESTKKDEPKGAKDDEERQKVAAQKAKEAREEAERKEAERKEAEKEDTPKDDGSAKIEADIKSFNDNIEAERTRMTKAMKDLDQAKRDLKTGRGSEDKVQKIEKSIEDSKEDIAELKKKEADAKKKLQSMQKENFDYVAESISEKFSRLMKNV